jgi:hypothetical protein
MDGENLGWSTLFAWQAACTSVCYGVATQTQGLVVLNNPDYNFQHWHGTLGTWVNTTPHSRRRLINANPGRVLIDFCS